MLLMKHQSLSEDFIKYIKKVVSKIEQVDKSEIIDVYYEGSSIYVNTTNGSHMFDYENMCISFEEYCFNKQFEKSSDK